MHSIYHMMTNQLTINWKLKNILFLVKIYANINLPSVMFKNFSRIGKETISKLGSWTILAIRHIGIIAQTNLRAGSQEKFCTQISDVRNDTRSVFSEIFLYAATSFCNEK